jgi:hypothetical protein
VDEVIRTLQALTANGFDYAPVDPAAHAGLLLVNARRWPRTPTALPRLRAALDAWMKGTADKDQGVVGWL